MDPIKVKSPTVFISEAIPAEDIVIHGTPYSEVLERPSALEARINSLCFCISAYEKEVRMLRDQNYQLRVDLEALEVRETSEYLALEAQFAAVQAECARVSEDLVLEQWYGRIAHTAVYQALESQLAAANERIAELERQ